MSRASPGPTPSRTSRAPPCQAEDQMASRELSLRLARARLLLRTPPPCDCATWDTVVVLTSGGIASAPAMIPPIRRTAAAETTTRPRAPPRREIAPAPITTTPHSSASNAPIEPLVQIANNSQPPTAERAHSRFGHGEASNKKKE